MDRQTDGLFDRTRFDVTRGSISKNIWRLALPMIAANVLQTLFNIVDMIFVGRLGPSSIAAVALSGVIMMLIMTVLIGIAIATQAMVARFVGARDNDTAADIATQSLLLGTIASLLLACLGIIFSPYLLNMLGATNHVLRLGTGYLRIMFAGTLTMFLMFLIRAILHGAGNAVTPMGLLIFSTILNIILDPLLIFGIGPFPRLGVNGAACATVTARGSGMIIGLFILLKGRSGIKLRLQNLRVDLNLMWRIVKIGIFSSLQALLRNMSQMTITRIVAVYGTFAIAAYGIGMRVRMVVMMPGFGLATAAATLVGQSLGAQDPKRAERSSYLSVLFYEILMICMGILFFLFARQIVGIFNSQTDVINVGSMYLRILSLSFVFLALSIVLGRAMNGAGDTLSPMVITFVALLGLRIPLAVALSRELGTNGIWLGMALSDLANGLITTLWFSRGKWKEKKV